MPQGGRGEGTDTACKHWGCGGIAVKCTCSRKGCKQALPAKGLSTLRFLARQGCAIRGHGDETDGNFHQLLKLRGEEDEMVYH